MTNNKLKLELIREINRELGLKDAPQPEDWEKMATFTAREPTIRQTQRIIESQFACVAFLMRKGDFEGVRLPYLGKYHVKPGRLQHLNNPDALIQRGELSGDYRPGVTPDPGV